MGGVLAVSDRLGFCNPVRTTRDPKEGSHRDDDGDGETVVRSLRQK
jgi:hypothetical protein